MTLAIPVLLADTTRWPSAARLAIALSNAGLEISAVCPARGHPVRKVRSLRQAFVYSPLRPLESLAAAIKSIKPAVVIPCDDRAVQHLHELYERARRQGLSGRYVADTIERSLGAPESYPIVARRNELLKIAHQEGLRVATTHSLQTVDDLAHWQEHGSFPCVLKADGTGGGYGVRVAQDLDEARRLFFDLTGLFRTARVFKRLIVNRDPFWLRCWLNRSRPSVVVQSYIHGHPANCAVVCHEGRVLAGIAVEVVCAGGPTEPATVVRVADAPEMMLAAERIARCLRLSGFFGLDFVIEEETRAAYLIEMNPRSTPLCHLRLGKCRDMVAALSAQLSDEPVRDTSAITRNDMIAYFPQAWQTNIEWLESSFQDIPSEEPELVQELLNPWLDRTLTFRLFNYLYRWTGKSKPCSFAEAAPPTAIPGRKAG
jgi:hypothetical protein